MLHPVFVIIFVQELYHLPQVLKYKLHNFDEAIWRNFKQDVRGELGSKNYLNSGNESLNCSQK